MRMLLAAAVVAACAACGDNTLPDGEPLATARALTIIAHQDDDLLFMQPDEFDAIRSGLGVTNIYVTAGNGTQGVAYAERRDEGLRAAYAAAAGYTLADWTCGWIEIAAHPAEHCRLDPARVSLVFLNYPDGGIPGSYPGSLLSLWEGTIDHATTVARRPTTYTQAGLVATLAAAITATNPALIRTLEVASTHGSDHSDHMIVGALALLGAAQAGSSAAIISYRGYDVENEGADTAAALVARSTNIVQHYDACVDGCAACGPSACPLSAFDPAHAVWIARRYAVGFRAPLAPAQLVYTTFGQCLAADADGSTRLVDCAAPAPAPAPTWAITASGAITSGSACIQVLPTGELDAAPCDPTAAPPPNERWFLDDEGHIWSGVAPIPTTGMDYAHLDCLVAGTAGGKVHTDLCGMAVAPTWDVVRPAASTAVAIAGTARAAIGDVDGDGRGDLVVLAGGSALAYAGSGDGTFAPAATLLGPLAVDPASLALGDLDRDARADACGRDADGVLCLVGSAQVRWTESLATGDPGDPQLAIVGGEVCGNAGSGFACATRGSDAEPRAGFPAGATGGWAADLDGDGIADACAVATAGSGVACTLFADRGIAPDIAPWSFSLSGVIDSSAATTPATAFADLDGDGLADACDLDAANARVACARSQAHGFGPRYTAAALPASPQQLVLGDLDGDGRADVCVLDGAAIHCALSP